MAKNVPLIDPTLSREQATSEKGSGEAKRATQMTASQAARHTWQTVRSSIPLAVADLLSLLIVTMTIGALISAVCEGYFSEIFWTALVIPVSFVSLNCLFGSYPGISQNPIVEFRQSSISITTIFAILFVALVDSGADCYFFLFGWTISLVLNYLVKAVTRKWCSRQDWWRQPAIIFGSDEATGKLYESFEARPELGLRPVATVNPELCEILDASEEEDDESAAKADKQNVFWAIVAQPDEPSEQDVQMFARARARFPQVLVVPERSDLPSLWSGNKDCGGISAVHLVERLLLPVPRFIKRTLDLLAVVIGGTLISPILLLLVAAVKFTSAGPIFYSQKRLGQRGEHFQAWKFRTMVPNADEVLKDHLAANPELQEEWDRDHKLKNDPRVTWVGKFLRKTSLDELPQLWNVLVGEMSLVGPRPIVDAEIEKYGPTYQMYKRVLPGITGLWQVSGRNNTSYEERLGFDSYYVRNWSPWFDLFILIRTIKTVAMRDGAY